MRVRGNHLWLALCATALGVALGAGPAASQCDIQGPTVVSVGESFTLCGPSGSTFGYEWSGPGLTTPLNARCVTIRPRTPGTYDYELTTWRNGRNARRCTHRVQVRGTGERADCAITGPRRLPASGSARLCADLVSGASYRWSGPGGYASTERCVDVTRPGSYAVTVTDVRGFAMRCSFVLEDRGAGWGDDPDAVLPGNCPRDLSFWRRELSARGNAGELSDRDLRTIARCMDERSGYFNWSDDLAGFRSAVSPAPPMTHRKAVARQYAALLANVCSGRLDVGVQSGDPVALDENTTVEFRGQTWTVGQLMTSVERLLRSSRGNFRQVTQRLHQINSGHGIGPVCE